jgi:hypothetical protein
MAGALKKVAKALAVEKVVSARKEKKAEKAVKAVKAVKKAKGAGY